MDDGPGAARAVQIALRHCLRKLGSDPVECVGAQEASMLARESGAL
ncbi:hypothetical protein D187_005810 [Cystobacter fuscus DSM 2262]|uniref:Uncharacterized protein n=1 Tax=Cystobacter fuscus (strain ATCC 25194 / DSM 2262 / NBRC 100088 / M29) TaxID=1242864 RepID=S9QQ26_CYSF2|nr:hypothetical protein D187_005810 [Cystobacter fuscus DSM 2262]